ncbi:MAG: insulinase family protein, partial [Maricaulaceae bacterium]
MKHSTFAKALILSVCGAALLAGCNTGQSTETPITLPAGVAHVETVKASGDISIPYKKYTLENGLTVVLHEDKSDPIAHVDVTYHVGSGREDIGKSGFAHFFEHMMFQGSENVADEEHFKIITEAGGTLNGTTNSDRTNYFETVPSNQLEKMLWLEADRMGYFLNAVTQDKFEVQRETVKNERGQRVDNQPYGRLYERVAEAMYPEGHPYSWPVIGYMADLDRATLDDLKRFFLRWYGPNNATLTIGGDFDHAQTLEWVNKYFGSIPAGEAVSAPIFEPVALETDRYISMEDNVSLPLIYMAWPTVHANHPDEAPLDVLMSILGEGKTSLFYKNMEKSGLAVQSSAGHPCSEIGCQFTVFALPNPAKGASLTDLEKIMRDTLGEFETRGAEPDDLTRVKAGIVSGMIYGLESASGKVSQLAAYQTYRGTPDGISDDIARYENVSAEDVMRVFKAYIKDKPAVVMSIVPNGGLDGIAGPDTWQRSERTIPESAPEDEFVWSLPEDDFDRSAVPSAGENPAIKVPDVYKAKLSNDIPILGAINSETPTTTIAIRMKVGQSHESLDKLGVASNLAQYLNDSATQNSTAEELSNELVAREPHKNRKVHEQEITLPNRYIFVPFQV